MRRYRYQVVLILSLFICILLFFYSKNTINLSEYIVYYYEEVEEGYKPVVTLDYLALSSDIGSISEEDMNEKLKDIEANNILDGLATLFVSDYSLLINSIQVTTKDKVVNDGDYFKIEIKWDKNLEEKAGIKFASYNTVFRVKEPWKNTLGASIMEVFGIENYDNEKEYYSIAPLKGKNCNIYLFKPYYISTVDEIKVSLINGSENITVDRDIFEKYFISDVLEIPNALYRLDFSDYKYISFLAFISLIISFLFFIFDYKLLKDITVEKSYYLSFCILGIVLFSKLSGNQYNVFNIPNNADITFIPFFLSVFLWFGIVMEFFSSFNKGIVKGILSFICIVIMNISISITFVGLIGLFITYIFVKIVREKAQKNDKKLATNVS